MGDRALIQFTNGEEHSPAVYLHWGGSDALEWIASAERRMKGRGNDVSYSCARFIGVCHAKIPGNLSLGLFNQAGKLSADDSHGDAGCIVVHVNGAKWEAETFGGYLPEGRCVVRRVAARMAKARKAREAEYRAKREAERASGSVAH